MDEPEVIESFIGVYLLYSLNDKHIGKTYIGFTVDPNRRINQHNKGIYCGGARRTNNKGPWKMILIVHGFPNSISGLRFEWAWQNPQSSRRLQHVEFKKRVKKESEAEYRVRILSEMLRVGPWNRLPLTIRWLEADYSQEFAVNKTPPLHMPICYGPIKSKKIMNSQDICKETIDKMSHKNYCTLCNSVIDNANNRLSCLNSDCTFISHMNCLADVFLANGEYVPIEGDCPRCETKLLWGDLIRKMNGCNDVKENVNSNMNNFSDESDA